MNMPIPTYKKLLVAMTLSALLALVFLSLRHRYGTSEGSGNPPTAATVADAPSEPEPPHAEIVRTGQTTGAQTSDASIATGASTTDQATQPEIRGRVIDTQGHPVEGAGVSLTVNRQQVETLTGFDGTFAKVLENEAKYVAVSKDGYTGTSRHLETFPKEPIELVLRPDITLIGKVTDLEGQPIPRFTYRITGVNVARTDAISVEQPEGEFRRAFRHGAMVTLIVTAEGFEAREFALLKLDDVSAGNRTFALKPSAQWIQGTVTNEAGKPLPDITVVLAGDQSHRMMSVNRPDWRKFENSDTAALILFKKVVTDATGQFQFRRPSPDLEIELCFFGEDYAAHRLTSLGHRIDEELSNLKVVLADAGHLDVWFNPEHTNGLFLENQFDKTEWLSVGFKDRPGMPQMNRYTFKNLAAGDYVLQSLSKLGFESGMKKGLSIVAGETSQVHLLPENAVSVTGIALLDNEPVTQGGVFLYQEMATIYAPKWTGMDASGRFKLDNLLPGSYTLILRPDIDPNANGMYFHPDTIRAYPGIGFTLETEDLERPFRFTRIATVSGKVLADRPVELNLSPVHRRNQIGDHFNAKPDESGAFAFSYVPPGQYTLEETGHNVGISGYYTRQLARVSVPDFADVDLGLSVYETGTLQISVNGRETYQDLVLRTKDRTGLEAEHNIGSMNERDPPFLLNEVRAGAQDVRLIERNGSWTSAWQATTLAPAGVTELTFHLVPVTSILFRPKWGTQPEQLVLTQIETGREINLEHAELTTRLQKETFITIALPVAGPWQVIATNRDGMQRTFLIEVVLGETYTIGD